MATIVVILLSLRAKMRRVRLTSPHLTSLAHLLTYLLTACQCHCHSLRLTYDLVSVRLAVELT